MAVEFQIVDVAYGDTPGMGLWLVQHGREHQQFVSVLAQKSPPVLIPDFNLYDMGETRDHRRIWLADHNQVHNLLRQQANVTGLDLSLVDLDDEAVFYAWIEYHATEHQLLRQAFGIS